MSTWTVGQHGLGQWPVWACSVPGKIVALLLLAAMAGCGTTVEVRARDVTTTILVGSDMEAACGLAIAAPGGAQQQPEERP